METQYLLWSASMGGWMTKSATYHSHPEKGQRFGKKAAFELAKLHVQDGALGMIPVAEDDVLELLR